MKIYQQTNGNLNPIPLGGGQGIKTDYLYLGQNDIPWYDFFQALFMKVENIASCALFINSMSKEINDLSLLFQIPEGYFGYGARYVHGMGLSASDNTWKSAQLLLYENNKLILSSNSENFKIIQANFTYITQ